MICDLCGQNIVGTDESHICSTTALFRQDEGEPSFSERLALGFAMSSDEDVAGIDGCHCHLC